MVGQGFISLQAYVLVVDRRDGRGRQSVDSSATTSFLGTATHVVVSIPSVTVSLGAVKFACDELVSIRARLSGAYCSQVCDCTGTPL